mmetsp:Transcript_54959/g.117957  ORF Transcript_54959/g.117957 Transcript_54959/m.117957 type:complete len:957 (-) Transcript_54959:17-2887(-)
MNPAPPCSTTSSHGNLRSLEVIEDRSGLRRKPGLPPRYTKGGFLGKGGFAKCYKVTDMETKEVYAAKIVAKASIAKPRAYAKLRSEIQIHRSLDHEKVVKFFDYFEDSECHYIILELCPNQTLNEFMRKRPSKRLSEPEAMFYGYDLIVALKYLHRRRVIHRDLKLGNLFLDGDVRLKVGDFGLAAQLEHDGEKKRTICGTPNYIAPEILEGKHGHSYEVDIWSFGVIVYTMIIGRPPFETADVKTTYKRIRYNEYSFPDTVRVSDQSKDLVANILRTDPRSRPSLDEILASSWFASSRLPPPVPPTVSAFAVSPRVASGNSSARSETPERGVADFARIDSPVPRFPLRDRTPGSQAPSVGSHNPPVRSSHSAAPPSKQSPAAPPPYSGCTTPGRCPGGGAPGGRPPLAHRGNEENMMPSSVNGCNDAGAAYAAPMSPTASQALLGSCNGGAASCRPQSAHLGSCGSSSRLRPANAPPFDVPTPCRSQKGTVSGAQSTGALRSSGPLAHAATSRESSPIPGNGAANAGASGGGHLIASARLGSSSARATTCSPRQPLSSVRLASNGAASKENQQSRSARSLGVTGAEAGAYGSLFSKATPALLSSGTLPATSRPSRNGDSPGRPEMQHHLGGYQQLTPGGGSCDNLAASGTRTPLATTPPQGGSYSERLRLPATSATGVVTPRQPSASARKSERSSSSPALFFDGPPPPGQAGAGGVSFGASYVPASGSRQCPGSNGVTTPPELWVTKWVDYSSKYGVGYILSDGSIGVYFNDSTKILLVPDGHTFDYVTRRTQEKPELRSTHTFEDYPEDLKKKVTLLRHFKNYMLTDVLEKKDGATVGESSLPPPPPPSTRTQAAYEPGQSPYVKKWTRNKHAIMFQLSNKIVQVVFFDKTEAVLSSRSHTVTYVDKKSQVCSYPLSNVLDVPSAELAKRLRYTKDILVNLVGTRAPDFAPVIH